jgi:hypothetical protein
MPEKQGAANMSKATFKVNADTVPATEFAFAGNQKSVADANHVVCVFKWRDLRGNVGALPKYVKNAIAEAGFVAVCLGGTTFSHSVIGLKAK